MMAIDNGKTGPSFQKNKKTMFAETRSVNNLEDDQQSRNSQ
jgi:hypothetical protein